MIKALRLLFNKVWDGVHAVQVFVAICIGVGNLVAIAYYGGPDVVKALGLAITIAIIMYVMSAVFVRLLFSVFPSLLTKPVLRTIVMISFSMFIVLPVIAVIVFLSVFFFPSPFYGIIVFAVGVGFIYAGFVLRSKFREIKSNQKE